MLRRPEFLPTRDYLCNRFVSRLPLVRGRMAAYRRLGVRIGPESVLLMDCELQRAEDITIGSNTIINQHCYLDGRGGLVIGNNVNLSSHVLLVAGSHDIHNAEDFTGFVRPIIIEDYAWLCTRSTILPGVTVGRGAIVAAGAVVTKSVAPYTVVAGVPARKIGERKIEEGHADLRYMLTYNESWQ